MKYFYVFWVLVIFISCKNDEIKEQITNPEEYNSFLSSSNNKTFKRALSEKEFWSKRLRPDSSGVGELGPLASAYALLFETTGKIGYLKSAEKLYKKAIAISANRKDSYSRSLSQILITQHRFIEAEILLENSYKGKSNKRATQLLLFDVYLELGKYKRADEILGKLKNTNDYNYLIRLAKWNDHLGNLDAAIRNLEKAKNVADSRKSKSLQIWTYTNLADFYGHAGRLKESYNLYIATLQLQADNAYAKKQLSWILYSFEKNTQEAIRILDSVMIHHKAPEYYLLKSEIFALNGETTKSNEMIGDFLNILKNEDYGNMYNSYLIEVYSEKNPRKALEIAQLEIKNRATPETYSLYAYAQFKAGNKKEALQIIINHVEGKTVNPRALYFSVLIFNANKKHEKVTMLKQELLNASFELGPIKVNKIENL